MNCISAQTCAHVTKIFGGWSACGSSHVVGIQVVEKVHICVEKHPNFPFARTPHIELKFLIHLIVWQIGLVCKFCPEVGPHETVESIIEIVFPPDCPRPVKSAAGLPTSTQVVCSHQRCCL